MKGIVITADDRISIRDFSAPLYRSVGETVDGLIEIVHPIGLLNPYCIIVNEEGIVRGLKINRVGSLLYGSHFHGNPILGDLVVMKTAFTPEGPDIVGLEDDELQHLYKLLKDYSLTPVETSD